MKSMRSVWVLLMLPLAAPLAAQSPGHPCANEPDPAARLVCYDKAFPPPPQVQEAAREQARARFGLEEARTPEAPGSAQAAGQVERIEDKVAAVTYVAEGLRSFRLENGQVWTQTDARSGGHVRAGEVVQVRKGLLGGYTLVLPNGVMLRVKRTR